MHIHWFRRDLRLEDNAGLYRALKTGEPVLPLFIFDTAILESLPKPDARVAFIFQTVAELKAQLQSMGSDLCVKYGRPLDLWRELVSEYSVKSVFANRDYEPYAIQRDQEIAKLLEGFGIPMQFFKDQVIFDRAEIVKSDGKPYTIFTPYSRKWREKLLERKSPDGQLFYCKVYPTSEYWKHLQQVPSPTPLPDLSEYMGQQEFPPIEVSPELIRNYGQTRDFPAINGTSRLGIHLRFGTVSIRKLVYNYLNTSDIYINELIWRDFYSQILWHFPQVVIQAFKPEYDNIRWVNSESDFECWKQGKTGYPLVDAGMRELRATGYMHNRVRMVVASFLTKHLLIDWRLGEAWFAEKLLDFDLASNNGGWQWAAGCGTDAAPYFRIFNPEEQQKKFDPKMEYIRRWVPEYGTESYPKPIIDHKIARARCLETYKVALQGTSLTE